MGQRTLKQMTSHAGGQQRHKDGYNVLYGDGHAAWYGDPQRRIIWWPDPGWKWYMYTSWVDRAQFAYTDGKTVGGMGGPWEIFHHLDVAAGVDVETTYTFSP